ncbi:MAG TPA: prepilin-type N-terminal cleavage/methylation domain-containing protein [Acidimicrobiales bacterium]|nr:prepilin-type N-terminal cleavage/methylation domain-containing protein [Acidimicrobiales bacterium]
MTAPSAPSDEGFTLIEVLVAVALMGITVTAILGGMGIGLVVSSVHRSQANANTVVVSAVEKVKSSGTAYQPCATSTNAVYLAAARSAPLPSGWVANSAITIPAGGVQYWDGASFSPSHVCNDALAGFFKIQLVTVQVTSPDGKAVESLSFVKRG